MLRMLSNILFSLALVCGLFWSYIVHYSFERDNILLSEIGDMITALLNALLRLSKSNLLLTS